jgi:uncharacterized membrane protein YqjE
MKKQFIFMAFITAMIMVSLASFSLYGLVLLLGLPFAYADVWIAVVLGTVSVFALRLLYSFVSGLPIQWQTYKIMKTLKTEEPHQNKIDEILNDSN